MSSNNGNHPLPPPPPSHYQRPGQVRPRAKSSFSFRSNHSQKSSGSGPKSIFTRLMRRNNPEDSLRKLTLRWQSQRRNHVSIFQFKLLHRPSEKHQANNIISAAVASGVRSSLAPIRAIQHRDNQGNPIADPDRSNPTRSRWERPLDTIRSFEAAIDESAESAANFNRRSSYYGGTQVSTDERPRYPQNGYYGGGRSQSYRPESTYMDGRSNGMARPDSYYNAADNGAGPSNGYYPNRARYPRTASEPHFNNGQGVYPVAGNQQSYETVTTASGSGSSADPAGYSTDPSSENSSVDRVAPPQKDLGEEYGFNGFGSNPQYLPPGSGISEQYGSHGAQRRGNGYQNQVAPPLPRKESVGPRVPTKLGPTSGNVGARTVDLRRERNVKSWFGKRFSKNA